MDNSLCKLTLIYPLMSEDAIIGALQQVTPPLPGYTSWAAEGHGQTFEGASVSERVRGRVRRGILTMVLPRTDVPAVLEKVASETPVPHIAYWVEPVEAFGRLEPEMPTQQTTVTDKANANLSEVNP